eukprot:TRINITY_DN71655_c0_g1_i1.p1 TRINITY_DN71655_c0_g1~~TRINITY_DN71655_c0_g1_i1.p1  ORF type:complete len:807 (-),score=94.07 TRINITY_DN71655_c0_g1_i1:122-2299(-)
METLPVEFGLAVVVGPSGAGKSNLIADLAAHYGIDPQPPITFQNDRAVASHPDLGGADAALDCLGACGFNRVPSWTKPFKVLSNGEGARARAAISLKLALNDGCVLDDFAATVDEQIAAGMAYSISKSVERNQPRRIIVGTSKQAVLRWLRPDFVICAVSGTVCANPFSDKDRNLQVIYCHPGLSYSNGEKSSGWKGEQDSGRICLEPCGEVSGTFGRERRNMPWALKPLKVSCTVVPDEVTDKVSNAFEFEFNGTSTSTIFSLTDSALAAPPFASFTLGAIVGPSGTGKTSLLRQLGATQSAGGKLQPWSRTKAVCSQLGVATPEDAAALLRAVDLPVHVALRPFQVLSASERDRAEVARTLQASLNDVEHQGILCLDEFTSLLDRESAKRTCLGVAAFLRRVFPASCCAARRGIVIATIHEDVLQWLGPDWIVHTKRGRAYRFDGDVPSADRFDSMRSPSNVDGLRKEQILSLLSPPKLLLTLRPLDPLGSGRRSKQIYEEVFAEHHYLTGASPLMFGLLVRNSWGAPVAFHAVSPLPGGGMGNITVREARFVVLPEFQGLGLARLSDVIGEVLLESGMRFLSKTAHPRLGCYRDCSSLWKGTTANHKASAGSLASSTSCKKTISDRSEQHGTKPRVCFSHQFVGKSQGDGNDCLLPASPSTSRYAIKARAEREAAKKKRLATASASAAEKEESVSDPCAKRGRLTCEKRTISSFFAKCEGDQ